jgi:predicted enzyme related to lactoylglutathione lyase
MERAAMKIKLTSVYVNDQEKALRFYTDVLGFTKKADFSNGPFRWLTVVSPDEPDGTELQLALNDNPAAKAYQQALFRQGQPAVMFFTADIKGDYERIKARGGEFTMPPTEVTGSTIAKLNDTCGNLIQITQLARWQGGRPPASEVRATTAMKKAKIPMKKSSSAATKAKAGTSPSRLIDARIKELNDWRGETLARVRTLIKEACPDAVEEWKWRGVPVWEHAGIICTGETYKSIVKLTFAKGAALEDPSGLFNSSLEGNTRRAIDIHAGEKINERALKNLVRAAVDYNQAKKRK